MVLGVVRQVRENPVVAESIPSLLRQILSGTQMEAAPS